MSDIQSGSSPVPDRAENADIEALSQEVWRGVSTSQSGAVASDVDPEPSAGSDIGGEFKLVQSTGASPTEVQLTAGVYTQVDVVVSVTRTFTNVPDVLVAVVDVKVEYTSNSPRS